MDERPVARLTTSAPDFDSVRREWKTWGVEPCVLISQHHLDPDNDARWNGPDVTGAAIEERCPNPMFAGPLVLDWEGTAMRYLRRKEWWIPRYLRTRVIDEFVAAIEFVRSIRPHAKVGYYNLPFREYWNQDASWRDACLAMEPIYDASSAIFPSVYDFYGHDQAIDYQRFSVLVRLALQVAGDTPVFLWVWHRYHNSTPTWGYKQIPSTEFKTHVRSLLRVAYSAGPGQQPVWPAGVCLFNSDRYGLRVSQYQDADGQWLYEGEAWDRIRAVFAAEQAETGLQGDDLLAAISIRVYADLSHVIRNLWPPPSSSFDQVRLRSKPSSEA